MVYAQSKIRSGKIDSQKYLGFEIQTDDLITASRPELVIVNEIKEPDVLYTSHTGE